MGSRKRSRPNPRVQAPPETPQDKGNLQAPQEANTTNADEYNEHISSYKDSTASSPSLFIKDATSTKSASSKAWYTTGSWPRAQKASPSIQIAKETILADKPKNAPASAHFSMFEPRKTDAGSVPTSSSLPRSAGPSELKEVQELVLPDASTGIQGVVSPEAGTNPYSTSIDTSNSLNVESGEVHKSVSGSGWLGWLGLTKSEQNVCSELSDSHSLSGEISSGQLMFPASSSDPSKSGQISSQIPVGDVTASTPVSSSSWFNLLPGVVSNKKQMDMAPIEGLAADFSSPRETATETSLAAEPVRPLPGSTWAFWFKDAQRLAGKPSGARESGELAVTGEESQNHPTPACATMLGDDKNDRGKNTNKRARQLPDDVQEPASKALLSDSSDRKHSTTSKYPDTSSDLPNKATQSSSPAPAKSLPPNLLLPSFRNTYRLVENPSIIQQISRLLTHSHQSPANHVYITKEPPKIRKALAIGIHGLFPAPLLRTVIGQPTGTSIRFANHAAAAICKWASLHDCDCEVEKVALEGEGKIAERVDNLWKLLLNWIDHVRSADLIMIACHSQGVPVAMMLVAKLIEFSVVTSARIGVCSMAGVSLGPFADYKSRLFSGSAAELFDFANQDSEVSKRYESSLRVALKYGVRVSFIGSIDDQLISLESAIFAPVNHPYIYRAVFVDGRVHAPDFITHLVGFAVKLRNLGVSDHGLIRELSVPLAGSLYTGEGHSRLYDEVKIYDDAVSFTLETTSVGDVPLQVQKFALSANTNPFQLPWSMRGLLEEEIVKTELDQETVELLKQFDEWKPTTKVLKDVKYRLEAVKSKL